MPAGFYHGASARVVDLLLGRDVSRPPQRAGSDTRRATDEPFEFKPQRDFDLHVALAVDAAELERMLAKGRAAGIETRGISDHGFCRSIYFRDPNGYVVELAAPVGEAPADRRAARQALDAWQSAKTAAATAG